jgi:hypothetical protein
MYTPFHVPNAGRCGSIQLHATASRISNSLAGSEVGHDDVTVFIGIEQPGEEWQHVDHKLIDGEHELSIDGKAPSDAQRLLLGIELKGRAGIELQAASLSCNGKTYPVDIATATWEHEIANLYDRSVTRCEGRPCLRVNRRPLATAFDSGHDVLDTELGDGLWLHLPLAVWTDGKQTFPAMPAVSVHETYAPTDLPERLATVMTAWGSLSLFFPFLDRLEPDWSQQLEPALIDVAAASTVADIRFSVQRMLTQLHDNHARAFHVAIPNDGFLPVAAQRLADRLYVIGVYGDFKQAIPLGAELLAIDGVPAVQAYDAAARVTAVATQGMADNLIPFIMTRGTADTLSTIRFRTRDGKVQETLLPHVPREPYVSWIREPRPAMGAELAPKVFYVDLEALKPEQWKAIAPSLVSAKAIIMDMRGYPARGAFQSLGYFADRPARSPTWQIPFFEDGTYEPEFWQIRPQLPHLRAPMFMLLDGRAGSAAETVLQTAQDNHLGTLIGEPSAGSNGNVAIEDLPGGFWIWFTGMRVPFRDGSLLQNRGVMPDVIVHPTREGILAGRDEILEAALARARAAAGLPPTPAAAAAKPSQPPVTQP